MKANRKSFNDLTDLSEYLSRCSLRSWEYYIEITARNEYRTEYIRPLMELSPNTYTYRKEFALKKEFVLKIQDTEKLIKENVGSDTKLLYELLIGFSSIFKHNPKLDSAGEFLNSSEIKSKKEVFKKFTTTLKEIRSYQTKLKQLEIDPTFILLNQITGSQTLMRLNDEASKIVITRPRRSGELDVFELTSKLLNELQTLEFARSTDNTLQQGIAWIFSTFKERLKVKQFKNIPSQVEWIFIDKTMENMLHDAKTSRANSLMASCLTYQVVKLFIPDLSFSSVLNSSKMYSFNDSQARKKFILECQSIDLESHRAEKIAKLLPNKNIRKNASVSIILKRSVFSKLRQNSILALKDLAELRIKHRQAMKNQQNKMELAKKNPRFATSDEKIGLGMIALGQPFYIGIEFTEIR